MANFKKLNDTDPFPFGAHKGKPMSEVPADYLDWLHGQSWVNQWPAVKDYIERCRKVIDWELKRKEREK